MYATELCEPRYAVTEAKWMGRPAERFAIAYYSEESLRELIAGPSIVGSGFISCQEALASIPGSFMIASDAGWRTDPFCESNEKEGSDCASTAELQNRFSLHRIWMIPSRLAHQAAAAFVLIACSKNIFSLALRAFIGVWRTRKADWRLTREFSHAKRARTEVEPRGADGYRHICRHSLSGPGSKGRNQSRRPQHSCRDFA